MIDNQQSDTLDLGRSRESNGGFTVAERAGTQKSPALVGDLAAGIEDTQSTFVRLRIGLCAPLRLLDDLARILAEQGRKTDGRQ